MSQIIDLIKQKHQNSGIAIHAPVTPSPLALFEQRTGFPPPADFKEFYLICNGFSCEEDLFKMTRLLEIQDYGRDWFYFAEYMMNSGTWGVRIKTSGNYEVFNGDHPENPLTSSLTEFLLRFLKGNVFDNGGLYDWGNELEIK